MKIIYIADDGKQFDDPWECEAYEELQKHTYIYGIKFVTDHDAEYQISHGEEFEDYIYNKANCVLIHNERELSDLQWLADYCGWSEFQQIDSTGMWKRIQISLWDGKWEKVR